MNETWTLPALSKKMKSFDYCFLSTHSENGTVAGRPMSNNGDVEYDGDSWFFVDKSSRAPSTCSAGRG